MLYYVLTVNVRNIRIQLQKGLKIPLFGVLPGAVRFRENLTCSRIGAIF